MKEPTIAATEFKARCLRWLDRVAEEGHGLIITKHGRPVARLVPIESAGKPLAGRWEGQVKVEGDVVYFDTSAEWEALG
jgi:prevent-host-death family protein